VSPALLVLAVDTSGPAVTAALHDGDAVLAAVSRHDPRRHAELLAPAIAEVLDAAGRARGELTAVVTGVGPGPFTGLRVGVVTALVLGAALGVPAHGVCSLDALAEAAPPGLPDFLVATDARRREVHWARYTRDAAGYPVRVDGPYVDAPPDVVTGGLPIVGRGAALYPEVLGAPSPGAPLDVDAAALATVAVRALAVGPLAVGALAVGPLAGRAAGGGVLLPPEPLYLRRPDAVEPGARKRVLR